jgi:hypothetical protein
MAQKESCSAGENTKQKNALTALSEIVSSKPLLALK